MAKVSCAVKVALWAMWARIARSAASASPAARASMIAACASMAVVPLWNSLDGEVARPLPRPAQAGHQRRRGRHGRKVCQPPVQLLVGADHAAIRAGAGALLPAQMARSCGSRPGGWTPRPCGRGRTRGRSANRLSAMAMVSSLVTSASRSAEDVDEAFLAEAAQRVADGVRLTARASAMSFSESAWPGRSIPDDFAQRASWTCWRTGSRRSMRGRRPARPTSVVDSMAVFAMSGTALCTGGFGKLPLVS
ncbi:MAG: hypothetical protein R3C69_05020 [Geminicoccaceae bacterium]